MPKMVRVSFDDRERAIDLFQHKHSCDFVRISHLTERKQQVRAIKRLSTEPACRPYREQQWQRTTALMLLNKPCELL